MRFRTRIAALAIFGLSWPAQAAFITVNTADWEFNSDGDCSLLEAVGSANDNTSYDSCTAGSAIGTDAIFISVNGTILMTGNLLIAERVDIFGLGENATTLDMQQISLHMIVDMPDGTHGFDLANLTLRNGRDSVPGGAVWVQRSGDLRFENMRFESNQGSLGGAIAVTLPIDDEIDVEIIDVEFLGNVSTSRGGAIAFPGFPVNEPPRNVRIERSLFELNQANGEGGALYFQDVGGAQIETSVFRENETLAGGSGKSGGAIFWRGFSGLNNLLSIRRSTFDRNTAGAGGGALQQLNGIVTIENSSFHGNRALSAFGNALGMSGEAVAGVFHSTLFDHDSNSTSDSSIVVSDTASLALDHTVIWNPTSNGGDDCNLLGPSANLASGGFNFDTDGTCIGHATDQSGVDPLLWPLGDYGDGVNGRVIETFLPRPGSPLVDGGQSGPCTGAFGVALGVDQRNVTRPLNGDGAGAALCDSGAVEFDIVNDPIGQVLNVIVVGSTGGTVVSSPAGIDCPGDCGEFFIEGSTVTLAAQPEPGFDFAGWGGDCAGTSSCQVMMTGSRSVSASFAPAGVSLSIAISGPGTGSVSSQPAGIDCPGTCSADFPPDSSVDLTAAAEPGSSFQHWTGACSGSSACSVLLDTEQQVGAVFIDADAVFVDSFE